MTERSPANPLRVAVIGGGVTGLAAAHRLREINPAVRVTLFETSDRGGGIVRTECADGYLLEHSADSFVTNVPAAVNLCRRLRIEDKLIPTNANFRRAFIAKGDQLLPTPPGFALMTPGPAASTLKTELLSWRGKARLLAERFVPARRSAADESVASFARRRLGQETLERIVQPLVGGIYTADIEQLSLAATFPQYQRMEREFGSIYRGCSRLQEDTSKVSLDASGARYGLFTTPKDGLSTFTEALRHAIAPDAIRLQSRVNAIRPLDGGGWSVETNTSETFDSVILATNSAVAASLLNPINPAAAGELKAIPYASSVVALLGYSRDAIKHPLDGFGFVVPAIERRDVLACSFSSVKFPGRAPDGKVLLRVFLGGAGRPEIIDWDDAKILETAKKELADWLGVRGTPELVRICRWRNAMPQYHVGHLDRVERIRSALKSLPHFEIASAALEGVGIPHCVRSGEQAAERIAAAL